MVYLPHANAYPVVFDLAIVVAVGLFALGIFRLWIVGTESALARGCPYLSGTSDLRLRRRLRHKMLMEWYVGFMLQGIALMVAAGAFWAFSPLRKFPAARWAGTLLAVALVCAFAVLSNPARQFCSRGARNATGIRARDTPKSGSQCAGKPKNHHRSDHTAALSLDPRPRRALTVEQYASLMQEADERGVALYVNNGFPPVLKTDFPGVFGPVGGSCRL